MIKYTPNMGSTLWNMKCQTTFENVEAMKHFIAEKVTLFRKYIGKDVAYTHEDLLLDGSRIMIDGIFVGYYGG